MKIDLENHFATEMYVDAVYNNPGYPRFVNDKETGERQVYHGPGFWQPFGDALVDRLLDVDEARIAAMDAVGIDVAVLSHTAPAPEVLEPKVATAVAQDANDKLAEAIDRHPTRYLGFATLGAREPEEAVRELERCVKELGFKGWNTHSNYGDSYLDDKRYWPILQKAEELGVPIYLHPTFPIIDQLTDLRPGPGRSQLWVRHRDLHRHDAADPERGVRRVSEVDDHSWPLRRSPPLPAQAGGPLVPAVPRAKGVRLDAPDQEAPERVPLARTCTSLRAATSWRPRSTALRKRWECTASAWGPTTRSRRRPRLDEFLSTVGMTAEDEHKLYEENPKRLGFGL